MKILLTEKEIDVVLDDWGKNPEGRQYDNEVAKAQLKKVVEWLLDNELIPSYKGDFVIPNEKFKALLKEVE